jgi:4-hydroxybenzoate polyprenyltransferase
MSESVRFFPTNISVAKLQAALDAQTSVSLRQRLVAHLRIARLDHCIKQAFILPGILLAMAIADRHMDFRLAVNLCIGLLSATLISSSNYVINEMLDAPFDRRHPTKRNRPAALGLIHFGWGYAQWVLMMLAGLALAQTISRGFLFSAIALWLMGCVYNISPIRSKDLPYIDVLSESINNPLRFCLGWYMVTAVLLPPLSMLLSYWMLGAYFMALKRFSEYRQIDNSIVAASYRKSFRYYNQESLLNSVVFYEPVREIRAVR